MADPPPSDLGADTKENLQNMLTRQRFGLTTERRPLTLPNRPCKRPSFMSEDCGLPKRPSLHGYCIVNLLIANVLHASAVGMGFIPVLPAADKIPNKYNAAARTGINPAPTVDACCKYLIISGLHWSLGWVMNLLKKMQRFGRLTESLIS